MTTKAAAAPLLDTEPQPEPVALARSDASGLALVIERLAANPQVDVDKLERIIQLQERISRREAEIAFNAAMTAAQRAMRPVATDAYNPQTKSRYASYEALDRALRPIYTEHGFGLSFNSASTERELEVRVTCHVTHAGGYSQDYQLDMPADGKGAKGGDVMTRTHATGSALSYGQRYLLKMIFNVAVGDEDDDGDAAGRQLEREIVAPEGFVAWFATLEGIADSGTQELSAAWNKSKPQFRDHLMQTNRSGWDALKDRAKAAAQKAKATK